ncbi:MFS transporter [Bacillus sp. B15-48]|uniref:MFS transporter n=1 Tax=Bacillus sp. B15-48 TaxID=1548601 RepID=UPI00193F6D3C|nr:MFS transporter [Bacillus sp. B15-48]MBM4761272.1 MFS transporter [Bacillus sp. B15-48]
MDKKVGKKRWMIIFLLFLCYTILYMDRSIMSMAGPAMMEHFNWSPTEFGWATTAFFIGYAITQIPGGRLADRFGGTKVIVLGSIFWSIFVFLTPFGYTLALMMLIRIAMGLGEGISLPAIHSTLASWVAKKESGKATGFVQAGVPFGIAVTMPIATWLILTWSWQSVFYVFAFTAPIWLLFWWKLGRDKPEDHPTISKEEVAYIKAGQGTAGGLSSNEPLLTNKEILSKKSIWLCALSYFCANYLFFLFMTWLPTYFVNGRGIDLTASAFYSMLPYLVAIFTYPLGGYLADKASSKFGNNLGRKITPIVGLSISGIFLILATQAATIGVAAGLITASNAFLTLTMGSYFTMPIVFSQRNAGIITGMFTTLGTVAGILAPVMTGLIIDLSGQYNYALYVGAGVALFGAIIMATLCSVKPIVVKPDISSANEIIS